ncbi:hypothetical protein [Natrononativus amylolyticus]|nr:hypothetical protein [Natrononativus amylolyticus]
MSSSGPDEPADDRRLSEKELFGLVLAGIVVLMALTGFVLVLGGP